MNYAYHLNYSPYAYEDEYILSDGMKLKVVGSKENKGPDGKV